MKVLVVASSSFAAQDLPRELLAAAHEVWTFNRRALSFPGPRDLSGSYAALGDIAAAALQSCDVLINYAIVKNGAIEQNIDLTNIILTVARQLGVKRFIHISSISVLPSITGSVDEKSQAVDAKWKGIYSRIKAAVERHAIEQWKGAELIIVRPGFILARGLVDSMVGIGLGLPTGQVLGLGNRNSIIPLIHRDTVNRALVDMTSAPLTDAVQMTTRMLVADNAPTRKEYLDFQCKELGRGWNALHLPVWLWRIGLACGSVALSLLKRKRFRLLKLFEHNLNRRRYNCTSTKQEMGLDLSFDWRASLREILHVQPSPVSPSSTVAMTPSAVMNLAYFGMGRIVKQRHLPGLTRSGFAGQITWFDPAFTQVPVQPSLRIESKPGISIQSTHAVITAPCVARASVFESMPASITDVLLEKPFAVSCSQLANFQQQLEGKRVAVIHNYRFKPNVIRFRSFLKQHPSGALRGVTLHYETPSPAIESSAWMKQERKHRILLTDYALHFLDLAWLFCDGGMRIHRYRVAWNDRDELETLSAALSFDGVPCDVLIRQGYHQRQCVITYHFQNYSAQLRFFPDIFVPIRGGHSMIDDARLAAASLMSAGQRAMEILGLRVTDRSHDLVLASFVGAGDPSPMSELSLKALKPFYERLTQLADLVYGEQA